MSTKYWDIYVLHIDRCVKDNYENDIDPAHYEMEWNHFWPKSIFGDWPVGQYLTLKQHAIATALQTLAFQRNCLCSWHKSYLPPNLLELAWPYFCEFAKNNNRKGLLKQHSVKTEEGKSIQAVKAGKASAQSRTLEEMRKYGLAMAEKVHAEKDKNGLSLFAVERCGSPRKRISVIYPDNSIKIFRSISEASRFLGVKRDKIKNVMNGISARWGKLYGLRFELVE